MLLDRTYIVIILNLHKVLEAEKGLPDGVDVQTRDMILFGAAGDSILVYNISRFTFKTLHGQDPGQLHQNLIDYITRFSPNVQTSPSQVPVVHRPAQAAQGGGILWQVFDRFCQSTCIRKRLENL